MFSSKTTKIYYTFDFELGLERNKIGLLIYNWEISSDGLERHSYKVEVVDSSSTFPTTPSLKILYFNLNLIFMKKLVLLMAVMFGMAFVSCTGCADKTVVGNDSDSVVTKADTTIVDSIKADSTVVDSVK